MPFIAFKKQFNKLLEAGMSWECQSGKVST